MAIFKIYQKKRSACLPFRLDSAGMVKVVSRLYHWVVQRKATRWRQAPRHGCAWWCLTIAMISGIPRMIMIMNFNGNSAGSFFMGWYVSSIFQTYFWIFPLHWPENMPYIW